MRKTSIIGLIPAAGAASRLSPLPFSKELYPINFDQVDKNNPKHPKTTIQYLLENMQTGGANNVFIVIRDGKWDIPGYLKEGSSIGLNIAYLMMGLPYGPPFTIDQAFPFLDKENQIVLFGFPDILIYPYNAFEVLTEKLRSSDADAIAGLFRVDEPAHWDMVKTNSQGVIVDIIIKRDIPGYTSAWAILAWKPRFSEFMHQYLQTILLKDPLGRIDDDGNQREIIISDVVKAAVQSGLKIEGHLFEDGKALDVGTVPRIIKSREFFQ
jgi:dTDP-glucose pyrophosphorylase